MRDLAAKAVHTFPGEGMTKTELKESGHMDRHPG